MALLYPLFALIAAFYATAGFGGGSSYLALLALWGLPTEEVRLTALACNVVVSGGGVWIFARAGALPWRKGLPLVLAGVPLAFAGGLVDLPRERFLGLLGGMLLLAAVGLFFRDRWGGTAGDAERATGSGYTSLGLSASLALGGGLGFLAGLVSIGGGIFLSPVLFFLRWDTARRIAGLTSLFILCNSLAGLAGRLWRGPGIDGWQLTGFVLAVFLGGQAGSRLSEGRLNGPTIRRIAALLVAAVALRLLWQSGGS